MVRVTLGGVMAPHVKPEGKGVSDNVTVPVNPPMLVTVMVEVPITPALTVMGEVAEIVKS